MSWVKIDTGMNLDPHPTPKSGQVQLQPGFEEVKSGETLP